MPTIGISQPIKNAVVTPTGFPITGQAWDSRIPEPHDIVSVTVQVDNGPVTSLDLKQIPNKKLSLFAFTGTVQITSGSDPHIVKVVATDDLGVSSMQTVTVFAGVAFEVSAPAFQLEITPAFVDPSNQNDQPTIQKLVIEIQKQLISLSNFLDGIGQTLAGPNLILSENPRGGLVLRVGLWIVGPAFPLLYRPDLLLPVLPDPAVSAGFNTVPFLVLPSTPDPMTGGFIAFGISVPTTTLQTLVDAALPYLKIKASQKSVSLDSVTVTCSAPGSVITSFAGSLLLAVPSVPVNGTITEIVGTVPVPGAQPPQSIPAIVGSSNSSGSDVLAQVLIGLTSIFLSPFLLEALIVSVGVPIAVGQVAGQVASIVSALVASLPSSIPFRNTTGSALLGNFPVLVPSWAHLVATNSGLLGLGTVLIQTRNQDMVAMTLSGPAAIGGYQGDLAGGADQTYGLTWANLVPDPDKFTWGVSGTNPANGTVTFDPSSQHSSFVATFPLPPKLQPGFFQFSLTVDAIETSGLDASQSLTVSNKRAVTVGVQKDPKVQP